MSRALNLRHVNAHVRLRQHRREELVRLQHEEEREILRRIWDHERAVIRARTEISIARAERGIMETIRMEAEEEDRERSFIAAGPWERIKMGIIDPRPLWVVTFFAFAALFIGLLTTA